MSDSEKQLLALKRAVREPLSALTAVEVDTRARADDLIAVLRNEVEDRPVQEIELRRAITAGRLHEECAKAIEEWHPDSGVLFVVDAGNMDEKQVRDFWIEMNALRESWSSLPCHVIFFLLPVNYRHLLQVADHLADWVPVKLHFTNPPANTQNYGLQKPTDLFTSVDSSLSPKVARQLIGALDPELVAALKRGEERSTLIDRFYFPMFAAALVLRDFQRAKSLRSRISESEIRESELPEWWSLNFSLDIDLNSISSAKEYTEKLQLWAQKNDSPQRQSQVFYQFGRLAEKKRDFETSIKWYLQSVKLEEKLGNERRMAILFHHLGRTAEEQRDFGTAQKWYLKAITIYEKIENEDSAATSTYHQLGMIAQKQRDFETAEKWYHKALFLDKKHENDHGAAITYHNLGMIAQEQQNPDAANKWLQKALSIFENQGDDHGAARAHHNLGVVAQKQHDFEAAKNRFHKARTKNEETGDECGAAMAYHQLGRIAQEQKEFATAEKWFRKALAIDEKRGDDYGAAMTYHELGILEGSKRKFEKAGKWLIKSFLIFNRYDRQDETQIVSDTFIKLLRQAGKGDKATMVSLWRNAGLPDLPRIEIVAPSPEKLLPIVEKTKETTR